MAGKSQRLGLINPEILCRLNQEEKVTGNCNLFEFWKFSHPESRGTDSKVSGTFKKIVLFQGSVGCCIMRNRNTTLNSKQRVFGTSKFSQ